MLSSITKRGQRINLAVACEALWAAPALPTMGRFGTCPTLEVGETPYTQRHQFGAVIALTYSTVKKDNKPSGTIGAT